MAFRDDVKPNFQTGDKPTQSQFYDFFNKIWFKDESIPIASIANLQAILNGLASSESEGELEEVDGDFSHELVAGTLLQRVIVIPGVDSDIKIGSVVDTDDIMPEENISSDGGSKVLELFTKDGRTIYFTGIPANSKVVFFKKLVNL
jgi:hypothetical protein